MSLDVALLQDICDEVAAEIGAIVTISKSRGEIVASSKRSRIGHFHPGVARIMAGDVDFYSVDNEEAAKSTTMLEGCSAAVDFEGERAGSLRVHLPSASVAGCARLRTATTREP